MFDFEVWHILGQKYTTADRLFQRHSTVADIAKAKAKKDIDNFILAELNSLWVSPISLNKPAPILVNNYFDNSQKIATHLTTLYRPPEMDTKEFNAFNSKAVKFKVQNNHLFRSNSKNVPMH